MVEVNNNVLGFNNVVKNSLCVWIVGWLKFILVLVVCYNLMVK